MRFAKADMPRTLAYFGCDTGDATHGFSGPIEGQRDMRRVKEHYPQIDGVKRMLIGHYRLVSIEEVPVAKQI